MEGYGISQRLPTAGQHLAPLRHQIGMRLILRQTHTISGIKIYLVTDDETLGIPDDIVIEYRSDGKWLPVKPKAQEPLKFIGNTANEIVFNEITANAIRITFKHTTKQVAVSEIECY
jgi:hypothetical protein